MFVYEKYLSDKTIGLTKSEPCHLCLKIPSAQGSEIIFTKTNQFAALYINSTQTNHCLSDNC